MDPYDKMKRFNSTIQKNKRLATILTIGCMLVPGCQDQREKTPKPTQPVPTVGKQTAPIVESSPTPLEPVAYFDPHPAEEIQTDQQVTIQAVGRASKSKDPSFAREIASNRAIHKIADFLQKKGYSTNPPDQLQGVIIERIWSKGRYTYAKATLLLSDFLAKNQNAIQNGSNEMNVRTPKASNPLMNEAPLTTTPPEGGDKP